MFVYASKAFFFMMEQSSWFLPVDLMAQVNYFLERKEKTWGLKIDADIVTMITVATLYYFLI